MYFPLNGCVQRYSRLLEADEDDEIPCVNEEISYLCDPSTKPNGKNYVDLQSKRFYFCQFEEECNILYSIAKKYMRQAEDALLSDAGAPNMDQIHVYIIDLLKLHRYLMLHRKTSVGNEQFQSFKSSVLKFTDLPTRALDKLIGNIVKPNDNVIGQYFHLQLDLLWLFATMTQENNQEIEELMKQLHFVSYKCWEKHNKHIVICKCVKPMWLRIQLYCENSMEREKGLVFWEMFNKTLECHDEEFSLLTLKTVANLQCYNADGKYQGTHCARVQENLEFFNKMWSLLMKNPQQVPEEQKVLRILLNVESLLSDLWLEHGKLDFFYLTWDYYYRKLEEIHETRPYQQLLTDGDYGGHLGLATNANGFLIFIQILRKHLRAHPTHWNKFKGRIYTKFPPSKFNKLTDQGFRNLALMFFAVAFVNFDEVTGKLLGLLKDLPRARQNTVIIWDVYIYLIKMYLEKRQSIEPVLKGFCPLLEEAARNRVTFHLVTNLANSLPPIFRVDDLTLKQSLLIDNWLENYLKSCAHNELISLLNTLSMIIERAVESGVWYEYQQNFATYVLATIRKLNVNQSIVGTVAGLIVAHSNGLEDIVEQFIHESVPGDVMMSFFMTLRRKSVHTTNERREQLIVKAWFLSWIIGTQNVSFTRDVLELLKVPPGNSAPFEEFLQVADQRKLQHLLRDSDKFFAKNLNLHVYTNMALVFHYCGANIYNTSSTTCYMSTFIDQFLLPLEVLRGNKPMFLPLVEKTWHLFVQSLWKLNEDLCNPYLERVLKDLTIRYIPHFSSRPTPLLKIVRQPALRGFLFAKIAQEYFEHNKAKHISDEHLFKALNTVNTLIDEISEEGPGAEMHCVYANSFLLSLFEVYMFKNHKVTVLEIVKKLAVHIRPAGGTEMKQIFVDGWLAVTKKHLAFSTNQYFQMAYVLAKVIREVLAGLLVRIREEIGSLECRRGQGFDNHLRQSYDKLVKLCQ